MHKICSGVHFAAKDFAFTKNHCAVCFYQRFLQLPTIGGCPLQFCPFCPPCLAKHAASSPISQSIRHSQYTPRHTVRPIIGDCVCWIEIQKHSCKLSDLRGEWGRLAVVNCELKTVNRIWSSRRSGACCMDLGRQQKHINWIDSFTLPLLLLLHQGAQLAANRLIS